MKLDYRDTLFGMLVWGVTPGVPVAVVYLLAPQCLDEIPRVAVPDR
jgi:hypothetical protein